MFGRSKSEVELLKASLEGSAEAFEVLVGKYQSLVCAITYSSTGSVEKSEELAQESFLRAWKSLHQLQDLGKFRAWLSSIARSTVQNWLRSRRVDVVSKAAPLDSAADKPATQAGPDEVAIQNEQQALVARALAGMPESLREPLVLFYREHQSVREVARQLDMSEPAARQRLTRARATLRDQVAAMVETTIARTKPGKAFTAAVAAALAASTVRTTTAAAAATTVASSGSTAVLSGLTAKLVTLAAGLAVIAGGVVLYAHRPRAERPPVIASPMRQTDSLAALPETPAVDPTPTPDTARPEPNPEPVASLAEPDQIKSAATPQARAEGADAARALSGRITDVDTGEPVRDARVRILLGSNLEQTRSDANGFYSFDRVPLPGNYQFSISSLEYLGISQSESNPSLSLANGREVRKDFQLSRACMAEVRVTDPNGNPISKAKVVVTSIADDRSREVGYTRDVYGDLKMHETDPNGYVLIGGIPPARTEYLVTVWHTPEAPPMSPMGYDFALAGTAVLLSDPRVIQPVRIALQKGQETLGYAHYVDGTPASDIKLSATPAWWHTGYCVQDVMLNPDGTFTFPHITPGPYSIRMSVPSGDNGGTISTTILQTQLPPEDGKPLALRIPGKSSRPLVSISGTVTFLGEPIPNNVTISATSSSGAQAWIDLWKQPNGKLNDTFVLNRLEPGPHKLHFSAAGIEEKVLENVIAPTSDLKVELICVGKPRLTGTVVDREAGSPIKSFRVRVRKLRTLRGPNYVQEEQWRAVADDQGRFSAEAVGPGLFQIQAAAEGYAPLWSDEISTDQPNPLILALSAGGTVTGMIVNTRGQPVDGAKVLPLSLASGAMAATRDTFVSQEGSVTTTAGAFTLMNLPPGAETLKIMHPEYATTTVNNVSVVEGGTTDGLRIVLPAGGTIEGYVYDGQGKPDVGQAMQCHEDSILAQSSTTNALGSTMTDSNGFYRFSHLPETACVVTKGRGEVLAGVVTRVAVPQNDNVTRLDFGGMPLVSGVVSLDGVPVARARLMLSSSDRTGVSSFLCYALTDESGVFTFPGVVPGKHAIYHDHSGDRIRWVKIAHATVANANVDLGVIPRETSTLSVTIDPHAGDAPGRIDEVGVTDADRIGSTSSCTVQAPAVPGGPWTADHLLPGTYKLTVSESDNVRWRAPIALTAGQGPWHVSVTSPRGVASVSGRVRGRVTGFVIWREDRDLWAFASVKNGTFSVAGLSAGRYFVTEQAAFFREASPLAEFTLRDGEVKNIDIDAAGEPPAQAGRLAVTIVGGQDLPCSDARAWLQNAQGKAEPLERTSSGCYFVAAPGRYTLHVQAAGYRASTTNVTVPPFSPTETKPPTVIVRLQP